ncbi:hypothetical protein GX50_02519 [[Emmonsia] crescens]|uniref:Nucleoside phosphorylase domain-containing protein n=1 Tax=[Emmonsia] crescens TaxID=73230 RepID=A0A2B7ZN69_9EURO|nr:hypothetical protein GX50_02519 [Emmonsia crescens]
MPKKLTTSRRLTHDDYTVACICPMGVELAPVEAMLDDTHQSLPSSRDHNCYTLGSIGEHNVVIAVMPETGNNIAATVATQLLNEFPQVRFGLLVGIGGGIPGQNNDIRLGDVVISKPTANFGGVVQFDMGKMYPNGLFERTGALKKPPALLMASVQKLESQHIKIGTQITFYMSQMLDWYPNMAEMGYAHPGTNFDLLFEAGYNHEGSGSTCGQCDQSKTVKRELRKDMTPRIHYGTIGSSNEVIKDAMTRDKLREDLGILCVETEAAGLMDDFSCLVIRGICDYADSHKNKRWQPYAAATAAAYAKELLSLIPAQKLSRTNAAVDTILWVLDRSQSLQGIKDTVPQRYEGGGQQQIQVFSTSSTGPKLEKKAPIPIPTRKDHDKDLFDAIIAKEPVAVARELAAGANPNCSRDYFGRALTQAIKLDIEIARLLIEAGADVNHPSKEDSPLIVASGRQGDRVKYVQLLLDHGADVDGPAEHRGGPLMGAAERGNRAIAKCLLEKRTNVHLPKRGAVLESALRFSSHFMHRIDMVKLLCDAGADSSSLATPAQAQIKWILNNIDKAVNPWHGKKIGWEEQQKLDEDFKAAVTQGRSVRIEQLWASGADINNSAAMNEAMRLNHCDVVKLLLELGARKPELTTAASHGYLGMIQLLIDKGVEVNPRSHMSPLRAAASAGFLKTTQLLINNGADVNYISSHGDTTLSAAAVKGHTKIVRLLVDNKADVNAVNTQDIEYGTALIGAAFFEHEDCVRILIQAGADVNKIIDKELFCALAAALEFYPISLYDGFVPKVDAKVANIVKMLCAAGADVSVLPATDRARVEGYVQERPACALM